MVAEGRTEIRETSAANGPVDDSSLDVRPHSVVRWAQENVATSLTNLSFKPQAEAGAEAVKNDLVTGADTSNWTVAAQAAESKKAMDLQVLDLREVTSFTDFFVICSASSGRQGQAIADEIGKQLKEIGEKPVSVEGYDPAEWILMDYGDFIVHVFSESARSYYDLERLWRHATRVTPPAQAS